MNNAPWTAIADPNRRAVLDVLRKRPCAVGELQEALKISQPAASKHLKVLREAGLVSVRVDAQRRIYAIETRAIQDLDFWLAPFRALWNEGLEDLGAHLDTKHPRKDH